MCPSRCGGAGNERSVAARLGTERCHTSSRGGPCALAVVSIWLMHARDPKGGMPGAEEITTVMVMTMPATGTHVQLLRPGLPGGRRPPPARVLGHAARPGP